MSHSSPTSIQIADVHFAKYSVVIGLLTVELAGLASDLCGQLELEVDVWRTECVLEPVTLSRELVSTFQQPSTLPVPYYSTHTHTVPLHYRYTTVQSPHEVLSETPAYRKRFNIEYDMNRHSPFPHIACRECPPPPPNCVLSSEGFGWFCSPTATKNRNTSRDTFVALISTFSFVLNQLNKN